MITEDDVLEALSRHIGRDAGITCRRLVRVMTGTEDDCTTERQVRAVIMSLRRAGHHICGHPSTGYYIAASAEELDATCSYLYERAMSSLAQVAAMKRVSLPDLTGQLRLPS